MECHNWESLHFWIRSHCGCGQHFQRSTSTDSPFQPVRSPSSMQRDCLTTGNDDVAPTRSQLYTQLTFSRHDWFGEVHSSERETEVRIRDFHTHFAGASQGHCVPCRCLTSRSTIVVTRAKFPLEPVRTHLQRGITLYRWCCCRKVGCHLCIRCCNLCWSDKK